MLENEDMILLWNGNVTPAYGRTTPFILKGSRQLHTSCNTLWSQHEEGGISIYSGAGEQGHAKVTYYSDENSIIVWDDNRNDPDTEDIYAQFVDMDGNLVFDISGIAVSIAESRQYKPRVKADSQGAYVIGSDTRYNSQTPALNDMFIQKLTVEEGLI